MPYKSKAQQRYFNMMASKEGGEWADRAHEWNEATKHQKGGFKKLRGKVSKAENLTRRQQKKREQIRAYRGLSREQKDTYLHQSKQETKPIVGGMLVGVAGGGAHTIHAGRRMFEAHDKAEHALREGNAEAFFRHAGQAHKAMRSMQRGPLIAAGSVAAGTAGLAYVGHRNRRRLKNMAIQNDPFGVNKGFVSAKARKKAAAKGQARSDGSFPIRNAKDLANAKHDIGRASNPAAARAWVNRRAKAMGLSGVGKADGYQQTFEGIHARRRKAARWNRAANVGTATAAGAAATSIFAPHTSDLAARTVGRRMESKATASSITHGLTGAGKVAQRADKVARAGRFLQTPGAGRLVVAGAGVGALVGGAAARSVGYHHQLKANEQAKEFNRSTKGAARIKVRPLTSRTREITKSAFGIEEVSKASHACPSCGYKHEIVSKTALLPKPFKGGKRTGLKPLKPKMSMPNANSKNDTTMAGSGGH